MIQVRRCSLPTKGTSGCRCVTGGETLQLDTLHRMCVVMVCCVQRRRCCQCRVNAGCCGEFADLLFEAASCSFNPYFSSLAGIRRRKKKKTSKKHRACLVRYCSDVARVFNVVAISCLKILLFFISWQNIDLFYGSCTDPTGKAR